MCKPWNKSNLWGHMSRVHCDHIDHWMDQSLKGCLKVVCVIRALWLHVSVINSEYLIRWRCTVDILHPSWLHKSAIAMQSCTKIQCRESLDLFIELFVSTAHSERIKIWTYSKVHDHTRMSSQQMNLTIVRTRTHTKEKKKMLDRRYWLVTKSYWQKMKQ